MIKFTINKKECDSFIDELNKINKAFHEWENQIKKAVHNTKILYDIDHIELIPNYP